MTPDEDKVTIAVVPEGGHQNTLEISAYLDQDAESSIGPGVDIAVTVQRGDLTVTFDLDLGPDDVDALIAALTSRLAASVAQAEERGYYAYLEAIAESGMDDNGWPKSWNVGPNYDADPDSAEEV